ncbi:hypothetical protein HC031_16240 [Planosporangium thailandense]|uniref:DUF397 domain-containing protein n=1 Tax=Planosporangium thailandense TaxID=765197 RepID=A0ABX0XYU8_9ACTN|nr:hypothetical protein [Planosporangium thailandense]NJC71250.1 hypothetical protein [Planosporangium thailandense]
MRLSLTVCDVCENKDREAKTYTVQSGGRTATTDRCEEHGAALEEVLESAAPGAPSPSRRPRRAQRTRTTTIEEIEAMKAARRH